VFLCDDDFFAMSESRVGWLKKGSPQEAAPEGMSLNDLARGGGPGKRGRPMLQGTRWRERGLNTMHWITHLSLRFAAASGRTVRMMSVL
jgi:hypothetical protein